LATRDEGSGLVRSKQASGLAVSVCIPARNEVATVPHVVDVVVRALVAGRHLVDEVIVVDDGSDDGTAPAAEAAGARVLRRGGPPGKGLAMADAAAAASGDVVVFLDADVRNFSAHFVTALLRPLFDGGDDVVLVKASYRRPLNGVDGEGGRVTELVVRPLVERLFPELAFVAQPLAGEVAIRRRALDHLVLEPGYGVEIGMLVDVAARFGLSAIAQADLGERVHRNRPLAELADQSRQIVAAMLDRAERPKTA
jgi:glucosyl-3-phosphoglycerate synthase